ncbi:hypothetical protein AAMO2058_000797900, partial [Amorphochlora amoebiformis]
QEFQTLISKPSYWEGRVNVKGTIDSRSTTGIGFLEVKGQGDLSSLSTFFKNISGVVREEIKAILPLNPTKKHIQDLIANRTDFSHLAAGLSKQSVVSTLIAPLRSIIDRGGKGWRSYALALSIDVVGGDSRKYRHLLALPEIIHCGSLIIDDIQDASDIRRGAPTCHVELGVPAAINVGTAAYFHAINILEVMTPGLSVETRLEIYRLYFVAMRAGHCGQGLDIQGLTHLMPAAVESGTLAGMGVVLGGGSKEQRLRVCRYFETLGLAFQIVDDVLSIRGFQGKQKGKLGEDIAMGKVTYPIARAMRRENLTFKQRTRLWELLKLKKNDSKVIQEASFLLEESGVLDQCLKEAERLTENAWKNVDLVLVESCYKIMMRAFASYVLHRHY